MILFYGAPFQHRQTQKVTKKFTYISKRLACILNVHNSLVRDAVRTWTCTTAVKSFAQTGTFKLLVWLSRSLDLHGPAKNYEGRDLFKSLHFFYSL